MEQPKWDWLCDYSVNRKRKYDEAMAPSSPIVGGNYTMSFVDENAMYPRKLNRIAPEVKMLEKSFETVFQDKKLLIKILSYLTHDELGNYASTVCRKWADASNQIIKQRHGTRPFLLYWTSELGTRENALFYDISRQLKPFIRDPETQANSATVVVFGTFSNWTHNPNDIEANLKELHGLNYLCGFFEHLWITHPTLLKAREISAQKSYGFQTLVIPQSPYGITELETFKVPIMVSENPELAKEFLCFLTNYGNASKIGTLRGILLMQFSRDPFMDLLFTRGLEEVWSAGQCQGQPMPSIISGTVENSGTNSDSIIASSSLASGFAIYGTSQLQTVSFGIFGEQFYNHPEKMLQLYGQIHTFFSGKSSGFIIFYYKPALAEEMKQFLKNLVPVLKVPIIGGSTYAPILVSGIDGASGTKQTNEPVIYDLTFLLVAY